MEKTETDRNHIIGDRVRYYRKAREMSMEELGKKLSRPVTAQGMALYETGQTRIPADLLCEMAIILGYDLRSIAGLKNDQLPRTGSAEWKAEAYKAKIMNMRKKTRDVVYRIIDAIVDANFQSPLNGENHDDPET